MLSMEVQMQNQVEQNRQSKGKTYEQPRIEKLGNWKGLTQVAKSTNGCP